MASQLINKLKNNQSDLDSDTVCDYNFFIGDLNYRMNATFGELIDKDIPTLISSLD